MQVFKDTVSLSYSIYMLFAIYNFLLYFILVMQLSHTFTVTV